MTGASAVTSINDRSTYSPSQAVAARLPCFTRAIHDPLVIVLGAAIEPTEV